MVHDDSTVLRRWQEGIERFFHTEPGLVDFGGGRELRLPLNADSLSFGESHRTASLQVADLLAGASAWMYLGAIGCDRADDFATSLARTPLPSLVEHILGPPGLAAR